MSGVVIEKGAYVSQDATIVGEVTIGKGTFIHPRAEIIADAGPIIIGQFNIIEELVKITNGNDPNQNYVVIIGNSNTFEIGSEISAKQIGNSNTFQVKSKYGYDGRRINIFCLKYNRLT
eukprot:TRINITY_DN220_c0_g2_i2.p1 TRINITY_DN220_c0_g2~~TRINITY_DN220_c0_g2_i2.p1  ORF type:complete len:119 (-),score=26.85 TRINITY_DN220_c0_g2_i2:38-394(-)